MIGTDMDSVKSLHIWLSSLRNYDNLHSASIYFIEGSALIESLKDIVAKMEGSSILNKSIVHVSELN